MTSFTITSNDTLTLNNRVIVDLADGDVTAISFPTNLMNRKTGKESNTVFSKNAAGLNADLSLRVMRGSSDDQFLQSLIAAGQKDFAATQLLNGTFVKRLGDGAGNIISDTYKLNGGMISKQPEGKENAEGDTSQGIAMYMIQFANATRSLG